MLVPHGDVPDSEYADLHTVVFDVNVYLDVARLVGAPFSWEKFELAAAQFTGSPVPNVRDRRADSLRAISFCLEGRFAGKDRIQVWTSHHIDELVRLKACQPTDGPTPEESGLGWSEDDAYGLLEDLVHDVVFDKTEGGLATYVGVDGHPPLSHEDACVFTTAQAAAVDEAPPSIKYCVTRDRRFRNATGLDDRVLRLYPSEFVEMTLRSRRAVAMRAMRPAP